MVIRFLFILGLPLLSSFCMGQETQCRCEYDSILKDSVWIHVDKMPRYKGGNSKMSEYLSKNYKIDPNTFDHNFKVGFIVKENGELYDIKIIQNYPIPLTDSENQIIKVFESMKKWKAGSCNGKKVPVRVIIPIRFYLADWYE